MPDFAHTLVIGGTGMLREATIALARRSRLLTAVSHSRNALRDLGQALSGVPCERRLLSLDWEQSAEFVLALQRHVAAGPPTLVVAWLHDPDLGPALAAALAHHSLQCHFFQVLGSDAADPARAGETPPANHGRLEYHRVVLGFHKTERESRWLTHAEISAGVLEAIALGLPSHVVGAVTPWSDRPVGMPVERLQT
jgi:hypothetical protein